MTRERKEKFKRLAEARTNKIIDMIALLGNLSNKSHYEYSNEQVDSMFAAIEQELAIQREKFNTKEIKKKKFRL